MTKHRIPHTDSDEREIKTFARLLRERSDAPTLDDVVALTCFCKFKPYCVDKDGPDCVRHRALSATSGEAGSGTR
jgi:hypothetical protein